ncbi:MAG: LysE family transporter [Candidatus Thiodiazotropha lotti]|uniref:LysE family translocator n=1 Tax=Candidatus Thiodiazotropha endoloripes TaxID=1818881 RepID=UPI00083CE1BE|nr:LysE family transporter [Candidatus Thiodiazotropha endoloripes]MCG7912886.1 LysE family transporter [Candidatus Thiodiazotropha weberae]MCG7992278.1 LysE family transporter [Candidatus Thiodiazotropha lotti]MCG8000404.1 LysE family transporter [Candidatus Thiodiazotropha lotti]MCW4183936.1 LysE family transporter [Candidatus Thiodiazotropha weberae]MCW4192174.1 LysE family transporter [Candidatus Thiodiazotropha weberae]
MLTSLTSGLILGISAGMAPGPLLTLVISETLQHNVGSGIRVALAPLITDLPIILVMLFIVNELSSMQPVLGLISLAGGCFVFYLGYQNIQIKRVELDLQAKESRSLLKGVLTNILSPHPYLFWFSVGGPIVIKTMDSGTVAPLLFMFSFYTLLVGSKIVLAIAVGRSKQLLSGSLYLTTIRSLGLLLCGLALFLIVDGLSLVGVL